MEDVKKVCPFKRNMTVKYRSNPNRYERRERFDNCLADKCMAYKDGACLRLAAEMKKQGGAE